MFSQISDLCLYSDLSVLYLYLDSNSIFHAHCVGVWFIFSCVPIAFSFASFNLYDWMEVNQMCVAAKWLSVHLYLYVFFFVFAINHIRICICVSTCMATWNTLQHQPSEWLRCLPINFARILYILEHCFLFSLWKTFLSIKKTWLIGEWRISL